MHGHPDTQSVAFAGARLIAAGPLAEVALKAKKFVDRGSAVLILEDATSEPIEVDFRGTMKDVRMRLNARARNGGLEVLPQKGVKARRSKREAARVSKSLADRGRAVLVFGDAGRQESGPREAAKEQQAQAAAPSSAAQTQAAPDSKTGPGRPKLGVVAREVTLLPRHWDWLNSQPGGASVALRKLVDEARRLKGGQDRVRQAQERAYRFMHLVAGDLPGFQEAARQLFAGNAERFHARIAKWPKDVRAHAAKLAEGALVKAA